MSFTLASCPVPKVLATSGQPGYWVDPRTRAGDIDQQQGQITEAYWVTADKVDDFVLFCAGVPQTSGVGGATVTAPLPVSWYLNKNFYAQKISWQMHAAGPSQWTVDNPFSVGLVTIRYGTLPYTTDGDQAYRSVTCDLGGSMVSVPGSVYAFADGTQCETGSGKFLPEQCYTITQYRQPSVPLAKMTALSGRTNDAPFPVMGDVADAETLLYMGGSWSIQQSLIGSPLYTIEHKVNWRSVSWNWAMHPDGVTGYAPIKDNGGTGDPPFTKSSFLDLFTGGL